MISNATEIRFRAERKAGEMLKRMRETGERAKGEKAGRRELTSRYSR